MPRLAVLFLQHGIYIVVDPLSEEQLRHDYDDYGDDYQNICIPLDAPDLPRVPVGGEVHHPVWVVVQVGHRPAPLHP